MKKVLIFWFSISSCSNAARATDRIHPDPKEEFSLNVLNNSPGEEAISSIVTKLEMAKDIQLQMGKV